MIQVRKITVFEHERLFVGERGFTQTDLDALLSLYEKNECKYFEPI